MGVAAMNYVILRPHEVAATLEGRQTQFCRAIKNCNQVDPYPDNYIGNRSLNHWEVKVNSHQVFSLCDGTSIPAANQRAELLKFCPYGKPGDRLIIKETWRPRSWSNDFDWMKVEYAADGDLHGSPKEIDPWNVWEEAAEAIWENLTIECRKADCPQDPDGNFLFPSGIPPLKWRSPVTMPRQLSRLTLEITNVRVVRVQELTEEDAIACGPMFYDEPDLGRMWTTQPRNDEFKAKFGGIGISFPSAKGAVLDLWYSGRSWDENPWVWVVKYKPIGGTA